MLAASMQLADKDIPTEVKEIVDRIGTKEQWLANYNPYDGDKLSWSELRGALQSADKSEMVKLYFTLLKDDPLLVIKARLNAVDLLWNIFEPTETYRHYGGHNNSYYGGITVDPGYEEKFPDLLKEEYRQQSGTYVKTNTITMVCRRLNAISYQNDAFKMIFWRNGIYLVILFWLFIVNALEGYKKIILAGLVPLATLGSLALAASWQIYQYYWFFPICVLFLALVTVAEKYDLQETVELHYKPNSLYDRKLMVCIYFAQLKRGLFCDEFFSYGLVNSEKIFLLTKTWHEIIMRQYLQVTLRKKFSPR